jgi:DNA-binding response OmpR family regulator
MDVLLVDDEPLIRELLHDELEYAGLSVVPVGTAEAGISEIEAEPRSAAVVTDVNLPGMDGLEFAAEVARRWPALPVFVMTGDDRNLTRMPDHLRDKCFLKPFSPKALADAVTSVLRHENPPIAAE